MVKFEKLDELYIYFIYNFRILINLVHYLKKICINNFKTQELIFITFL